VDVARTVPIAAGTHRIPKSAWSVADLAVTVPDGWTLQYGHVYSRQAGNGGELGFYPIIVDTIYADACRGELGGVTPVGPRGADLVAALLAQPGAHVTGPVMTTLGDRPAQRLDLEIPAPIDWSSCSYPHLGLQIWHSIPTDKYLVLLPGGTASVYVLDVDGSRQVVVTQTGDRATSTERAELQTVLDSIRFE
jgi:hypothetical protein